MQTYANKASARKGATRKGFDIAKLEFLQNSEGRWFWCDAPEFSEWGEAEKVEFAPAEPTNSPCLFVQTVGRGTRKASPEAEEELAEFVLPEPNAKPHVVAVVSASEKEVFSIPKESVKIEKDRPEQNGVIRPSAGGKCRAVWDACDGFLAENGRVPMPKEMKALAVEAGWNENNAVIEMYQWRKFNNIVGRQKTK